ncbi:MAG: Rho-binding antiterminator [Gammaproteobacteria bacterium]|nr:Rho-binding antiterminator [Gammaproteobacteria bacterium]MBU2056219.1 Rho-binding antiterminator [Gammaproteobacteria bacterium]MBU2177315.1 Rho-binding antiterminator [Gammaproteobacteria bacterium]MBU2248794.1 Rho-binding antiterminator [Gammaproteobacteria bacterium]MBU2345797.1 Rho-binding antiterminator [Gammaproteobacteria bacterium]
MKQPVLACDLHDHVEIICMRRYQVLIHQLDGSTISGIADDTRTTAQEEFLLLEKDGQKVVIPLMQIERIEVVDANAPQQEIWLQQRGSSAV